MKQKMIYLALMLFVLSAASMNAQVTIGSDQDPHEGAILDLSQSANLGLLLPRVFLENVTTWQLKGSTEKEGMVIYNTNEDVDGGNGKDIYVWTRNSWKPIGPVTLKRFELDKSPLFLDTDGETGTITAQNFISSDDQPLDGVTVSWSVVAGAVPGDVSIFDVDNTFTVISGSTAGSFTVRATAGGISHDCVVTIVDCPNTMKDIEANEYTVGWFGSAGCWMTQNLRSTKRSENETLTENVNSDNSNTACYYYPNTDNTILNSHPEYGLLYTWAAANIGASVDESSDAFSGTVSTRQGICPSGWHLPSDYEWNQLEKEIATNPGNYSSQTIAYANASGYDFGSSTSWRPSSGMNNTYWGRQMKSTTAVNSQATTYGTSKSRSEGGFDVLLVGGMGNGSAFLYGTSTYFWSSSSSNSSDAWYRDLAYGASGVARNTNYKFRLFSVRCKKDDH